MNSLFKLTPDRVHNTIFVHQPKDDRVYGYYYYKGAWFVTWALPYEKFEEMWMEFQP